MRICYIWRIFEMNILYLVFVSNFIIPGWVCASLLAYDKISFEEGL